MATAMVVSSFVYFPNNGLATITNSPITTSTTTTVYTQRYLGIGNFSILLPPLSSTPCGKEVRSQPFSFILQVNSKSSALLCVTYYYYNKSAPFDFVPTNQITIFGWPTNRTGTFSTFSANSNFTITSQPQSLQLGGPADANEGSEVTYYIQAKPGVRGTFEMNLGVLLPGGIGCGGEFLLSAGNGAPNYARPGLCNLVHLNSTFLSPLPQGFLFVALVGATNSTG